MTQQEYFASLAEKLDREIQEQQLYYQRETALKTERIKNNVVFFFWFFIAILVIAFYNIAMMTKTY